MVEAGALGLGVFLDNAHGWPPAFGGLSEADDEVYLRFSDGPIALYGPNGVGKTRVLRAVREALCDDVEATHSTCLFIKQPHREFSAGFEDYEWLLDPGEGIRNYLADRRPVLGGNVSPYEAPDPLPDDLKRAIAGEALTCRFRSRLGIETAVGIPGDPSNEAVRHALQNLFLQIRRPFDDPEFLYERWIIEEPGLEVLSSRLLQQGAVTADELEGEALPAEHPAIREHLSSLDWAQYINLLDDWIDHPEELSLEEELLAQRWPSWGFFVQQNRPVWAPWPLEQVPEGDRSGFTTRPEVELVVVDEIDIRPETVLGSFTFEEIGRWFSEDPKTPAQEIADLATEILARLLNPAPRIGITTFDHDWASHGWHVGTEVKWLFFDAFSGLYITEFEKLSPTLQRWVALAIDLAVRIWSRQRDLDEHGSALVYLCDEPETGLPVAAQRYLSDGIASLFQDYGVTFIVATHSGAILADPRFNLTKVGRRTNHASQAQANVDLVPIDSGERDRLERAGVPISEMLYLYRVVLLVEGLHDLWVLDELIGRELQQARVKVVPVHGAKQAASLFASEAGLIFEHVPEAKFVVAVDGTKQELLEAMLTAAFKVDSTTSDFSALDQVVRDGSPSDEAKVMQTLLRRAVETDRLDDIAGLFGFIERDIIEYLDPAAFGLEMTWPDLRNEHHERLENKKGTPRDFKKWLELSYNAGFDEATIRSAVPQDSIPEEVLTLLDLCRTAGGLLR